MRGGIPIASHAFQQFYKNAILAEKRIFFVKYDRNMRAAFFLLVQEERVKLFSG
jgi:hypothetical protein